MLGHTPDTAIDEYGILLSETDFAKAYPVCEVFPEGTVVCLRTRGVMNTLMNKKKSDREYDVSKEMFISLVNFKWDAPAASEE